jgi:hypothetical protein
LITFESGFVLERGRFLFGRLKKLPRVTCVGSFVLFGEIFSLSDEVNGGGSISSDEACGVIRGEVGGVMSNIRLEDDWVGRDRPYVTGCLSLIDPSLYEVETHLDMSTSTLVMVVQALATGNMKVMI